MQDVFPPIYAFVELKNESPIGYVMLSDVGTPVNKDMVNSFGHVVGIFESVMRKMLILLPYSSYISDLKLENVIKYNNDYYLIDFGSICNLKSYNTCVVSYTNKNVGNDTNMIKHMNVAIFVLFTTLMSYLEKKDNKCYQSYKHFNTTVEDNCNNFYDEIKKSALLPQTEPSKTHALSLINKIIEIRDKAPYNTLDDLGNDLKILVEMCQNYLFSTQQQGGRLNDYKLKKYLYKLSFGNKNKEHVYKQKISRYHN